MSNGRDSYKPDTSKNERPQADKASAWDFLKMAPRLDEEDLPLARDKTPVQPSNVASAQTTS